MKFGLALSGGGIKGISHLGVLKALEEYNIKPEIITGTSSGAIIAGLYSYGLSYKQIYNFFMNTNSNVIDIDYWGILRSLLSLKIPNGIVKGDKILNLLNNITNKTNVKNINKKKLAIVSTNLKNGNDTIFTNADFDNFKNKIIVKDFLLSEAIRASMSFPIIFKPFVKNNNVFVDGGIVDNCPAGLCQALGAEFIFISNMSLVNSNFNKEDNGINILSQITTILVKEAYQNDLNTSEVSSYTLNLDLKSLKIPIVSFDKKKLEEAFNYGYNQTKLILEKYKFNEL